MKKELYGMKNDVYTFYVSSRLAGIQLHILSKPVCCCVYHHRDDHEETRDLLRKWNEENHTSRIQSFGF